MKKWYDIYPQLANALHIFYRKHGSSTGTLLYNLAYKRLGERKYFSWLSKNQYNSLDPIQIFSSFNRHPQTSILRSKVIEIWCDIFDVPFQFEELDFTGCPTPLSIKITSFRDITTQTEIWEAFASIMKNKQDGLNESTFVAARNWYGIDSPSFTIFLFWIAPKYFLPLDRNTEILLRESGLIRHIPRKYADYRPLLLEANTQLYIELAKIAYDRTQSSLIRSQFVARLRHRYKKTKLYNEGEFDFKIIAIRPLPRLDTDYKKVLRTNEVYTFYNEYQFLPSGKIRYNKNETLRLYDIENIQINISAVVGKNGSGKSSISELLYLAINNISYQLLKEDDSNDIEFVNQVYLELYIHTTTLFKVALLGQQIVVSEYKYKNGYYANESSTKLHLGDLFYTIAISYSHYSLNSLEMGYWIDALFHKNDAYQTPLVINPYRKEGNIDINRENELVKARLLANLLEPINSDDKNNLRVITDNKRSAKKIIFKLHEEKIEKLDNKKYYRKGTIVRRFRKYYNISFDSLSKDIQEIANNYIASKLTKICTTYKPYKQFLDNTNNLDIQKLDNLFKKIEIDPSHIAYKIKQIINFFRYDTHRWFVLGESITIEELSNKIETLKSQKYREQQINTIELIPPSFYDFDIFLNDNSNFKYLSSGEKQKIYTVSSIVYHLNNLNSVWLDNDLITYPFVNIIFDEVELYFHPEMQRTFISYLLEYLKRTSLDNVLALNFCFITHSPFILSDIPHTNILFLSEKGEVDMSLTEFRTFGGNIHDLLAHSFFLKEDGYMGELAKQKIETMLEQVSSWAKGDNNPTKEEAIYRFIQLIGEPIIKQSMLDLYREKIGRYLGEYSIKEINDEIKKLEDIKKRLQ